MGIHFGASRMPAFLAQGKKFLSGPITEGVSPLFSRSAALAQVLHSYAASRPVLTTVAAGKL
jgi:hypothetical protein